MKASLATALSISGVFAAGATALAVNSAVLVTPSAAGAGTEISVPSDSTLPSSPDVSMPDSGADLITSSDTSATYEVGEAGTVVVDMVDGIPVIVSVAPAAGWTADVRPATSADDDAKVIFTGPSMKVMFEVDIENGVFDVEVESAPLTATPRDDEDEDDDHDEDDDEDDEDDDHDDHDEDDDEDDD